MKTNLLFFLLIFPFFVFAQSGMDINFDKLIKKSDFLKNTNAIVQTLDTTINSDYVSGVWVYDWKKTINGRHWNGLPYEWKAYSFNTGTDMWNINSVERITYNSNSEQDIDKYLIKPYNSFINDWDPDTAVFYNYTGYVSHQIQQPIMEGIYMQKSYNSVTNSYTSGIKYVITNLYDTLYDYFLGYTFDPSSNAWKIDLKNVFTYDQNHYLQCQKSLDWNSTDQEFVNNRQTWYVFNNGNATQLISQGWTGTVWLNDDKDEYSFDSNGNRTSSRDYNWNNGTNSWDMNTQTLYTFVNNLLVESVSQTWNSGTSTWDNTYRTVNSYDVNGNQITQRQDSWVSGAWQYSSRNSYTYDSGNHVTLNLYELWDNIGSAWRNNNKYTYTYNLAGLETNYLAQVWNSVTLVWVNQNQYTTNYDVNNNKIYYAFSNWDEVGGTWIFSWKYDYYWSTFDANSVSDMENEVVSVFPNPNDGLVEVDSKNLKCEMLRITDANGRVISEINTTDASRHVVNLRQYGSGLYYFQFIEHNGESNTKKVVVN